ncbi:MAG: hypothetical protein AAFO95_01595 [Cyanobacteria bacterium J06600_6]
MTSNNRRTKIVIFIALFLATIALVSFSFSPLTGSKIKPEWLGNPLREDGQKNRALNVWDMQVFDGKVYVAGGSTVTNSGPINVWAYNPQSQEFDREYTVEEEAIEHFRVLDNQLYIPAADPTQGDRHKFYRRQGNSWQRYDSSKIKLAHVRDLVKTDTGEILMVGNARQVQGSKARGTAIAIDGESGFEIRSAGVENAPSQGGVVLVDYNWYFSVFRYQDRIFATNTLLRDADNFAGAIAEYEPQSKSLVLNLELRNDEFIPAEIIGSENMQGIGVIYRPWKPVQFQDYLVYPVRSYSNSPNNYIQAYMNTIGFFYKSEMGSTPQTLKLPKGVGEDVLLIDDELYVLANQRNANDKFTTYVYKTDVLSASTKWQRVLKFSDWNKARSFEYLDGTFYFGLGQDYGEEISNSGDILSYRSKSTMKIEN